jgi:hypothetical protein
VEAIGDELRVRFPAAEPRVSDAYLLTAVRAPDEVVAAFGGTVRDAPGGRCGGAAAGRGGARGVRRRAVGEPGRVPAVRRGGAGAGAGRAAVRFEVRYRLAAAPGWPTRPVSSPAPVVAGDPPVARWWSFADGVRPGWPVARGTRLRTHRRCSAGPLTGGPPALVTRSDDEWVRVGSTRAADALAAALVALVIAGAVLAARPGRAAVALAAVTVAALTATELGPPWWARAAWPVLFAALLALARILARAAFRPAVPIVAGLLAVAFAPGAVEVTAQPVGPATVLLVPAAGGGEEVIAPHSLVDRLDALARPVPPPPAVVSAAYDVRADDAGARVTARFVVHAFRPGDNAVTLSLADARLERARVGGAAAFPAVLRPGVYEVPVGGPGRHEVEVRFAAAVTAAGGDRELRFGVPEVPGAALAAALPGAARQPQAVGRFGRQVIGTADGRTTLAADLGAAKLVHLRWREGAGGAAAVKVREGCVWDVTDAGAELTAAYLVQVERGAVDALRFDVPAELEVLRVAVRGPDAGGAPPALKDWQLGPAEGGVRPLALDLREPVGGRFLVVLECAPRHPVTRHPVLRFPRVVFGPAAGETDAVYALRAARVAVEEVGRSGVIDYAPDALRDFAAPLDLKFDPNNPVRAFRPVPGRARAAAGAAAARPAGRADGHRVGGRAGRADACGTVAWSAKGPAPLIEFAAPGVKVLEVRGPDVLWWGQSGGRVQVWRRAGAKEGAVEWSATAAPGSKGEPFPFDPGAPAVAGARLVSAEVRVRAVEGWVVRPTAPAGGSRWRGGRASSGSGPTARRRRGCGCW